MQRRWEPKRGASWDYFKGVLSSKTALLVKAWKAKYADLTADRKMLNQQYLALKEEVKEAEQIRKSVFSILQQVQQPRTAQNMETITRRAAGSSCFITAALF